MRKYLLSMAGVLMATLLLSQVVVAQDKDKDKDKNKSKSVNDEIVIRRKTDKDAKVTIEIKGDEVTVNGKPVDDYDDDNVSIHKRKSINIISPRSPFRGQTWSYGGGTEYFKTKDIAFLGVVTEENDKGAKIEEITDGSAAEKAGLKEGDILTKIDDIKVDDPDDVTKAIHKHQPEEKANITYLRDGKENQMTVTLGRRKGTSVYGYNAPNINVIPDINWNEGQFNRSFSFSGKARLGIKAQDTEEGKGVKVLEVDEESAAEKAGVKENDIITEFDGQKVNSADDLAKAARDSKDKPSVKVVITRDGKTQNLEIKTPRKLRTTNL